MNTANLPLPAGTRGPPNLTMRDIVLWHQEEAFSLGELDFHTNFPNPSNIFKPFQFSLDSSGEAQNSTDVENDVVAMTATMQDLNMHITGLYQRRQLMDANEALVSKTEVDVTQKLRAAGVPEERLGPETTLRQKVVELVRLKLPKPEPNFVTVYVSNTEERCQMLEINLPLKASMAEVYDLLAGVVVEMLLLRGFTYERGGAWKYQLVDRSGHQLLLKKSLPLETDLDYEGMLETISRNGNQYAPVAVLTQVSYSLKTCLSLFRNEFDGCWSSNRKALLLDRSTLKKLAAMGWRQGERAIAIFRRCSTRMASHSLNL